MSRKKWSVVLSWVAVLLWLGVIFYLSSQPAAESDGLSRNVTKVIVETVERVVDLEVSENSVSLVAQFDHVVRKYAHFISYLILGVLVINSFRKSGVKGVRGLVFPLLFCVFYAASDEFHQSFVPGRGPQAMDVLIDSLGAFGGIGIFGIRVRRAEDRR